MSPAPAPPRKVKTAVTLAREKSRPPQRGEAGVPRGQGCRKRAILNNPHPQGILRRSIMSWIGILVLILALLVFGLFLWSYFSARLMRGRPISALAEAIPELGEAKGRVVIYCYSEKCAPCRQMTPQIDEMRERHSNLFKLDVRCHLDAARALGVRATPTTLLVEDGRVLKALLGAGALGSVRTFLEED